MKPLVTVLLVLTCTAAAFAAGTNFAGVTSTDPQVLAGRVVDNLLSRDYMLHGKKGLHYAEACTAVGALRFADKTNDAEMMKKIIARYEKFLDDDSILISRHSHVDHNVMGIVPFQIYLVNGDKRWLELGLSFAD